METLLHDRSMEPAAQEPYRMIRETKGGTRLEYVATILQEPERARACGAGQKSTNDRRPVDPPPVVELRIFDITPGREKRDITFTYNANFFIFISLTLARPMAHGRVQATNPVLAGTGVSGMALLDRPSEAGYFLFPDLSVRHEGFYKLVFDLYEETKEVADMDADEDDTSPCFIKRISMCSQPFQVFSAKKFPGLKESTPLSRNLSDQGVRVRIRRDIRMRKRDGGKGGNGGSDAQKAEGERIHRPRETPEVPPLMEAQFRQRSTSAASDHSRMPYDVGRRPSAAGPIPPPLEGQAVPTFSPSPRGAPVPSPTAATFSAGQRSPIQPAPSPSPYGRPIQSQPQWAPVQPQPPVEASPKTVLPSIQHLLHSLKGPDTIEVDDTLANPVKEETKFADPSSKKRPHQDDSVYSRYRPENGRQRKFAPMKSQHRPPLGEPCVLSRKLSDGRHAEYQTGPYHADTVVNFPQRVGVSRAKPGSDMS